MSTLYSYFSYLVGWNENKEQTNIKEPIKKFLITPEDLKNVKLEFNKDVVPSPARNMPLINTFELLSLNKAQLQEILNIKLKPVEKKIKQIYYPPRHPVIREMHQKFGIGIINEVN
jgi:hypothetical protein